MDGMEGIVQEDLKVLYILWCLPALDYFDVDFLVSTSAHIPL